MVALERAIQCNWYAVPAHAIGSFIGNGRAHMINHPVLRVILRSITITVELTRVIRICLSNSRMPLLSTFWADTVKWWSQEADRQQDTILVSSQVY